MERVAVTSGARQRHFEKLRYVADVLENIRLTELCTDASTLFYRLNNGSF